MAAKEVSDHPPTILFFCGWPDFYDSLQEHPEQWFDRLSHASLTGMAVQCCCREDPKARAGWSVQQRGELLVLVHKVGHRKRHADHCIFSARGVYPAHAPTHLYVPGLAKDGEQSVITPDSTFASLFAQSSIQSTEREPASSGAHPPSLGSSTGPSLSQHRLGLRATLQHLAETAKLNHWTPSIGGYRTIQTCLAALFAASEHIFLGKSVTLRSVLFAGLDLAGNKQELLLRRGSADACGNGRLFVGFLNQVRDAEAGKLLVFHANGTGLFVPQKRWENDATANKQHFKLGPDGKPDRATLVLAVGIFENGRWACPNFVFQRLSKGLVISDSEPEAKAADTLCGLERRSRKVVARPEGIPYVPDFELLDCEKRTFVEVAGRERDVGYRSHLEKKLSWYREHDMEGIPWFPSRPFPELPPAVEFHQTYWYRKKKEATSPPPIPS